MLRLPDPEFYFPVSHNAFSFKAGLNKLLLATSHNQQKVFQIDNEWPHYHHEKLKSRQEDLSKYVLDKKLSPAAYVAACQAICDILKQQQSAYFSLIIANNNFSLHNKISDEILEFDKNFNLLSSNKSISPMYENLLDALCCQVQEDFSIVHVDDSGHDTLAYLHLCFPNHWAGKDKIGKCFQGVHKYVPAMEAINKSGAQLSAMLASQGPFERFTWGIATDNRLNHHPQAPVGTDPQTWQGRNISANGPLFLRVERQVTVPFHAADAYMFSIRTYFINFEILNGDQLARLINAIETMPELIQEYKGIAAYQQILLSRLQELKKLATKI